MKAALLDGLGKPVRIENVPDPTPGAGEVVLKVCRCGICGTDLHMVSNPLFGLTPGARLGHEFAGEVVALGAGVEQLKIGDRIAAMPMAACGKCAACLAGRPIGCAQVRNMMGGFGEYAVASARFATRFPADLSLADGALVEPLAAALRGVRKSRMEAGARVLVLGAGSMGMATVFWARRLGAGKIVATARSAWREAMALEMGADAFVVSDENLAANVNARLGGAPDIVFECTGATGTIAQAIDLVRPGGMVLVEGGCMETDHFVPFFGMYKEVCIQFAVAYTTADFQFTVDALERGALEPQGMVTDTIALDALPAMLESLKGKNHQCKVLVDPWSN